MNLRWTFLLAIITFVLLGWFYSLNQSDSTNLNALVKTPDKPEYIGKNMQTTVFSPKGIKQYLASAELVEHYEKLGNTHFTMPLVYLFDVENSQGEKQSWKLSADQAILDKNNMLYLTGNVTMQSLLADSRLQRVETESAVVNLTTQDIHSDQQVKIAGQHFHSTGLKLTGNLQQQVATLKEQVKTYYEIKN